MVPKIEAIATTEREYLFLIELAKSAQTRNLIGTFLKPGCSVELMLVTYRKKIKDKSLKKRIDSAKDRFTKELKKRQKQNKSNQEV